MPKVQNFSAVARPELNLGLKRPSEPATLRYCQFIILGPLMPHPVFWPLRWQQSRFCLFLAVLLLAACSSVPPPSTTTIPPREPAFQSAPPPPPFVHPVPGARISSMFANHIVKSRNRKHHGVDFAAPQGTPVYAASSGVVLNADMGSLSDDFGKVVLIEHGDKLQSLSAHLSRIDVQIGDFVQAGQQIGLVGKTGRATGPHLHFELWRNGHPQDPLHYLPLEQMPERRTSP